MPGLTQRLSLPKVHRRLQSVTRPAGTLGEQTESSWHAAYPNVFPLVSPGKLAQTVLGLQSSYRKISFNLLQGELQKSRMSQKPEQQNLSNPPSSLNFLLSFFHSLHQFNTLIVMNVRKRQKKQRLRISLCQRVWLLTQQSATAPFACDPEERFISAELLWRALSCHLLERHWPCSLPRLWVRGGRREGQEAAFTARLWPRGTGGGCPGEGTHCRKHFPLPTLQNLPNAAGRNAEDHCLLKQETGSDLPANNSRPPGHRTWKSEGRGIPLAPFHLHWAVVLLEVLGGSSSTELAALFAETHSLWPNVGISGHFVTPQHQF